MTVTERATFAAVDWQRWSTDMQIVVTDPDCLAVARREVEAELDTIEAAASRFRPDSEINSLTTSSGRPTEVSDVLADLLDAALTAARLTDGDVDPTLGAALIALGYDDHFTELTARLAASVSISARWSMITLQGQHVTIPRGIVLDLGATAKAVAADRCAQRVHIATGSGALVNLGGDLATAGPAPDDDGWQILVHDDDADPASSITLPPGAAMATSSTVRRRWRNGTDVVHHILDPRTGLSADPVWRTVSVAAQTCFAANTVSTAAVVRGWGALKWIAALGMPARFVDSNMGVHLVGGWPSAEVAS